MATIFYLIYTKRAMSWQNLDPFTTPVAREGDWINFQASEIPAHDDCHNVNEVDQSEGLYDYCDEKKRLNSLIN